jgi:hypothetical protein
VERGDGSRRRRNGWGKKSMIGGPGLAERKGKKVKATGEGFPRLLLGCPSWVGPVGLGFTFFLLFFSIFLLPVLLFELAKVI